MSSTIKEQDVYYHFPYASIPLCISNELNERLSTKCCLVVFLIASLVTNQTCTLNDETIQTLIQLMHSNRRQINRYLSMLEREDIIRGHCRRDYFVNPYVFFPGISVPDDVYDIFSNSQWKDYQKSNKC